MQSYIITASDAGQFFAAPMQCLTGWLSVFSPQKKPGQGHQRLEKPGINFGGQDRFYFFYPRAIFCGTDATPHRLIIGVFPLKKPGQGHWHPPNGHQLWSPEQFLRFSLTSVQPQLIVIVFIFFLQGILQGIAAANASPHRVIVGVILPKKETRAGVLIVIVLCFSKPAHARLCTVQYHSSSCNTSKVNHSPLKKPGQRHWLSTLKPRTIYIFLFYLSAAPVDCDCFDFFFRAYCMASQQPMQYLTGCFVVFFTPKESGTGASTSGKIKTLTLKVFEVFSSICASQGIAAHYGSSQCHASQVDCRWFFTP